MKATLLLSVSALLLAVLGLACLFAPTATLSALLLGPANLFPALPGQLLGAALLGLAALNWLSRGSAVGGIYGRPLVVANLAHFLVGALVLVRPALALGSFQAASWLLLAFYAVFGFLFLRLLIRRPAGPA
jgi:hypothetical protein